MAPISQAAKTSAEVNPKTQTPIGAGGGGGGGDPKNPEYQQRLNRYLQS